MKILFFLVIIGLVFANQAIIDEVNSKQNLWIAGTTKFSDWKTEDIKSFLKTDLKYSTPSDRVDNSWSTDLPDSYNFEEDYAQCSGHVQNQAKCGSCWAFGTATSFAKRRCRAGLDTELVLYSEQELVSCDNSDSGCNGGNPEMACEFVVNTGLVSYDCFPYTSGNGNNGQCKNECVTGTWDPKKMVANSCTEYQGVQDIATAIYTKGPVCSTMEVYADFLQYKGGIYKHTTGELLGGHAITTVGWGVENDQAYWIVQNSWGTTWGEDGFFRIVRGTNDCQIENFVIAGTPATD
ncbi:tubulointerstitial nephritis antigen-like 1 [Anaeramoeba flamelloides]|uniref:Tubulointerstitial nephritis antigen-like 1 n=1 Tax=Anaeramoeba flamelloides TaxID=1746091 RepID=A0ABQ8XN19_9EUKA|nr:tubulointerstitial nephritis antigen-like 1 [Anaeramoeba flamelloides]